MVAELVFLYLKGSKYAQGSDAPLLCILVSEGSKRLYFLSLTSA